MGREVLKLKNNNRRFPEDMDQKLKPFSSEFSYFKFAI